MDKTPQVVTRFSHIVIFWTDPANPNAAEEFLAGANQLLKDIPGVEFEIVGYASSEPAMILKEFGERYSLAKAIEAVKKLENSVATGSRRAVRSTMSFRARRNPLLI